MSQDIEDRINILHSDIDANAEAISAIESRLDKLDLQQEKQEQYSRRENIILHGIEETANDNDFWSMRNRCTDILNGCLNQPLAPNDIVRAHRLGKEKTKGPRPIIIRFKNFADKLAVLKSRSTLKDKGIGVANDLTRNQRSELQALKDKGQKGYFKNGQLHIDNNKQNQPKERSYLTGARRLGNNR